MNDREFKVNKYILLRLEGKYTVIHVNGKIDYSYQKKINKFESFMERNCPNCKELLEANAKFCRKCGTIIQFQVGLINKGKGD